MKMTEERNEVRVSKKKNGISPIVAVILILIFLTVGFCLGLLLSGKNKDTAVSATGVKKENNKKEYSKEDLDEEVAKAVAEATETGKNQGIAEGRQSVLNYFKVELSLGNALLKTLRPLYPNELVMVSGGAYHFVPINNSLKKNEYKQDNLKVDAESGLFSYYDGDRVVSHKGIDVSKFQGKIDWQKVAGAGVEFAFIRVGNRGYGVNGKMVEDDCADQNMDGAAENGIPYGVYFFTQAINEEEMLEEANFVIEKIKDRVLKLPVVIDVERVTPADGRMNALSAEERTRLVKLFCETIEKAGHKVMIYHNLETGALMLNLEQLEQYDKWFASYSEEFYNPYAYKVWQYSPKGRVDGIDADVDLNISFSKFWEE